NRFTDEFLELVHALAESSRDGQHRRLANLALELLQIFLRRWFVNLVRDDVAWFLQQRRIVKFQFSQELFVVVPRRAIVRARHVEQEHEQLAALDMAQERMT